MSYFKKNVSLTGALSPDGVKEKWAVNQKPIVGKPYFKHEYNEKLLLYYHSSYKKDLCDTMFEGEIYSDDETCQLDGVVKSTKSMLKFAVTTFIVCFILGVFYLFVPIWGYALYGALGAIAVGAAIGVMSLRVDKYRLQTIIDYLQDFINSEGAENDEGD